MTPALRHYLVTEHMIGSAVVNIVLNALIAWLSFRPLAAVPMWGQQSIFGDLVGTCIVLPTLNCLIVTQIVRMHIRRGRIGALDWSGPAGGLLQRFPRNPLLRGLAGGVLTAIVFVPLIGGPLVASGIDGMQLLHFVVFKASYAAVMAACVQPFIALWALMAGAAGEATAPVIG